MQSRTRLRALWPFGQGLIVAGALLTLRQTDASATQARTDATDAADREALA